MMEVMEEEEIADMTEEEIVDRMQAIAEAMEEVIVEVEAMEEEIVEEEIAEEEIVEVEIVEVVEIDKVSEMVVETFHLFEFDSIFQIILLNKWII